MHPITLAGLGWSAHFLRQLSVEEVGAYPVARITAVHRDRIEAIGEDGPTSLTLPNGLPTSDIAVGDWVLTEPDNPRVHRLLDRQTLITRRAAGTSAARQLVAANLDTLAIVTSCNAEFNEARLERYLSLARGGGVQPVVILTKADEADPDPFRLRAERAGRGVPVLALDARDTARVGMLGDWCRPGQTLGLVGSSGVGKSTLAASLTGLPLATQTIREDDARGRHTTTSRHLLPTVFGGWLLDTPGMRELRLTDAAEGVAATFDDVAGIAAACRFSDCRHDGEPGCAVEAAVAAGDLDPARLRRWQKLMREDRYNSETLAEAHRRHRAFGRMARAAMRAKLGRWKG